MKTETYVCQACGIDVVRPVARGQRPKWCPDCRKRERTDRPCAWCGSKPAGKGRLHCSRFCGMAARSRPVAELPKSHPVMLILNPPKPKPEKVKPRSDYAWRTARECPGCACWFTPLYTPRAIVCSLRCSRRVHKRKRRARENAAQGAWVYSDFMRIARKFDYCCAYCGVKPDRLDPDHVVPLSRGGYDSPANLLPACPPCNTDKQAMTLTEWAAWRAERGKPPRITEWEPDDGRFTHLTQTLVFQGAA